MITLQVCINSSSGTHYNVPSLSCVAKGEDYVDPGYDEDDPFRYDACARENCFTIDILNDNKVEDMTEQFGVTLEFSGGGGTAVTFQQDTATVTIIDEDGRFC